MSANNATVTAMTFKLFPTAGVAEQHGGSLAQGRALFPQAPEPWIDLSTGINPHSYPVFDLPDRALSRLPEPERLRQLIKIAAATYGAAGENHIIASPGTQPLLPLIYGLVAPGCACIAGPTYGEHARCARLAGHRVDEVAGLPALEQADLAVLVNPDNPSGRLFERARLLLLADKITARGGLLVVDEAFMDVAPPHHSLAGDVKGRNLVVLRSFGKFFGLAGVRLSFAVAPSQIADYLTAALGPWPVAVPALDYGLRALGDHDWQVDMRHRLAEASEKLRHLLSGCGLELAGGTDLFQFVRHEQAGRLYDHLGRSGILVRRFDDRRDHLRFGLPGLEVEWERLQSALDDYGQSR